MPRQFQRLRRATIAREGEGFFDVHNYIALRHDHHECVGLDDGGDRGVAALSLRGSPRA
jgi:hypothetical protein